MCLLEYFIGEAQTNTVRVQCTQEVHLFLLSEPAALQYRKQVTSDTMEV